MPFSKLFEIKEYHIHLDQGGPVPGYWLAFERIANDYETKAKKGIESKGYTELILELNRLHALLDIVVLRNVPTDIMLLQYEGALVMQYIARHILKEFKIVIHSAEHSEEREYSPSEQNLADLDTKVVTLPVKGQRAN